MMSKEKPPISPQRLFNKGKPAGKIMKLMSSIPKQSSIEEIKLSPMGASNAVKHFFRDYIPVESSNLDSVDSDAVMRTTRSSNPYAEAIIEKPFSDPIKLLSKQDLFYNMNHVERGCFMIFNYKNFDENTRLEERKGTDKDAENLKNMALNLGFEYIRQFDNCTKKETLDWINLVATNDHSEYDCFACAILTHGDENDVLYAHDGQLHLKDFTTPFESQNCPSLAEKPKLFFIQACRGKKLDSGGRSRPKTFQSEDAVDARVYYHDNEVQVIPSQADFLIAHSTAKEYYSWRNQSNGSIFIQALCSTLNVFRNKKDLLQMLTNVNCMVAYDWSSSTKNEKMNNKKQIPSITTQLTRILQFFPKTPDFVTTKTFETLSQQTTDELETDQHRSCRITHHQVTKTTTSFADFRPQDEVSVIRSSFYPPTGDLNPNSPRPNQLTLSPPPPHINITQATPVSGEGEFRFSRRQRNHSSNFQDQKRGIFGIESQRPLSYPQCHTHYTSSPGGNVFMETHFP